MDQYVKNRRYTLHELIGDDNAYQYRFFSMTQANQIFPAVARAVDRVGEAVVLKKNKLKYLVVNMDNNDRLFDISEDEKIDIVARRMLNKYS